MCEVGTKFLVTLLFSYTSGFKDWRLLIATVSCYQLWQAQWETLVYVLKQIPCGDDGVKIEYQVSESLDRQVAVTLP